MNAYISNDLNMVKELDPQRHELALKMEEFLSHGGTIEVLRGPSFVPPPARNEPPQRKKVIQLKVTDEPKPVTAAAARQNTKRQKERDERAVARASERKQQIERARKLAETMTYTQASEASGLSRKVLVALSKEGGFSFQSSLHISLQNLRSNTIDEAQDAKDCERIKAFVEIGLSRTQAMNQMGIRFERFNRLLAKFEIYYPKLRKGPHPAFFPKNKETSQ
jgi:hypothetical protein